jgi:hypothetical protein
MFKKILFFFILGCIAMSAEAQLIQQPSSLFSKAELNDILDTDGQIMFKADWYKDVTPTPSRPIYAIKTPKGISFDTLYQVVAARVASGSQLPSDWSAISGVTRILNKPTLFSGSYIDLSNKPTLFSGSYMDLSNKPSLFSGSYIDLSNKPTLFSGSYVDLTNKPTIPTLVNPDWNSSSGFSQILNKPTIPAAQINSDWDAVSGLGQVLNKPTIPTLVNPDWNSSSGFSQILNKPTIPAAQINADWNAASGLGEILNKPSLFSGSYVDLTNKPTIPADQTLSISGNDLSISGGNTVTLPSSGGGGSNIQVFTTTTTFSTTNDVSGDELTAFNFNCVAGKIYKFEYTFPFVTANATTGIKVWSQPFDGSNQTQGYFQASLTSAAAATEMKQPIPGVQPFVTTGMSAGSTGILQVFFIYKCTVNTTKTIRLGTEIAGLAAQFQPHSSLIVTTLN